MFFAFSVLLVTIFLFNLEVVISAVIEKDLVIPLFCEMTVFINLSLNEIALISQNI